MKNKLWGGRFSGKTNPLVEEFTKSIQFDKKLAEYDCLGSLCHIDILKKAGLLTAVEHGKLKSGLKNILSSIYKGVFEADGSFEDIHSYIQHLLEKKVGKTALKLHTCRSRNDQVALDTRMYCLSDIEAVIELAGKLKAILIKSADKAKNIYMPGYTHLQHAMPVALSDYFDAYYQKLSRDQKRLGDIKKGIELSAGSGALAGTFIHAEDYNKSGVKPPLNPLDAVSDRDFVIESLSALAIIGMHLSRLAEDLILWSTKEFDFIDIDESFCTGSSLMPQKKNPDVLELIRGNAGRLYGNLLSVLVMMKGLPLSYNRDMQLDKEPLFGSFEIVQSELKVLAALLPQIKFKEGNIRKQLEDETLYATDLADFLVQKGIAFKDAHDIIGRLIKYKLKSGKDIVRMGKEELGKFHPFLTPKEVKKRIDAGFSVKSKKSIKREKRNA